MNQLLDNKYTGPNVKKAEPNVDGAGLNVNSLIKAFYKIQRSFQLAICWAQVTFIPVYF